MRAVLLVTLTALAACSDPLLTLRFRVSTNPEAVCLDAANRPVSTCTDVTMLCRAAVSIRVFNPDEPSLPFISVCKELVGQPNLCAIAGVDLPQPAQPVTAQTLEIEMAVYPLNKLSTDVNGNLVCPSNVAFDARGFPVASIQPCDGVDCDPAPAIGGLAFYHPGDTETVVELGCTDLAQLNDTTCTGGVAVAVSATVDDFDTNVSVAPALADKLGVYIGEPKPILIITETHYQLNVGDSEALPRTVLQPVPNWSKTVAQKFASACVEVFEDGAATTTSVRCKQIPANVYLSDHPRIDATGTRLAKATLQSIVGALGLPQVPDTGLVVGMVLDSVGNPVPNLTVTTTAGNVQYLSADRAGLAAKTSANGIFMSTDAPYIFNGGLTTFSATATGQTAAAIGGLVDGKVTIVILQFEPPAGQFETPAGQ